MPLEHQSAGLLTLEKGCVAATTSDKTRLASGASLSWGVAGLDDAAVLSHELLAPLAILQNYAAMLKETLGHVSRERELQYIMAIERLSRRLMRQVQNVMECYSETRNGFEMIARTVSLPLLIKPVVLEMQKEAPLHALTCKLPRSMPKFCVDEQQIKLLLTNLIWNSIKYSPGGGFIQVALDYITEESGLPRMSPKQRQGLPALPLALVRVKDEGVGIGPEEANRLFVPFCKLQNESSSIMAGVGLGLHICKVIVQAHGGAIWAESQQGRGTAFFIALPRGPVTLRSPETSIS